MPPANEHDLAALVTLGICGAAVYRFFQWVMEAPRTLDPWGKETEEEVNQQGVSLCLRCLTPQEHNGWFCPECGATVGPYCNYLPYVYIFSEGEVLRAGVTDRIRRSSFITIGFVLLSVATFTILAPIYWFFLLKNLQRIEVPPDLPPVIP
jgi:hypothetical protein